MCEGERSLQLFISVYYSFCLMLSLGTNGLLLFFMRSTKSSLLSAIKYYLLNTTVCELLVSVSTFFAQCRPVANEVSLAVFCYGPCKYLGQTTCFVSFAIVQSAVVASSLSILLAFYYRAQILHIELNRTHPHLKTFLVFSMFPLASFLFQLLIDADFEKVEAETRALHPDYDYEDNALIGFTSTRSTGALIAQLIISVVVYMAPLLALYYRRKIHKVLSMSTNQRIPVAYCKQLVNGLFFQTLVPFCVYIPPYTYFLYSTQTGTSNIFLEYLLNLLGSTTAFITPMLTFYYVLPYRRALCKILFKHLPSMSEDVTETTYPHITPNNNVQRRNVPENIVGLVVLNTTAMNT